MRNHPAAVELGRFLQAHIQASGLNAREVARGLGYEAGYLSRSFTGRVPLRVRVVFRVLERTRAEPSEFFDTHYPLGGPTGRLLRGTAPSVLDLPGLPTLEQTLKAERRRRAASSRSPEEHTALVAELLKEVIRRTGKTQREISRALGMGLDTLGVALRGQTDLSFFHLFGVLDQVGMSPARFFAELFLTADSGSLEAIRFSQLLTSLERALGEATETLWQHRQRSESSAPATPPPSAEPGGAGRSSSKTPRRPRRS